MPELKQITVYNYDELEGRAKERARATMQEDSYHWQSNNNDSLEAFAKVFPVKIKEWSYGDRGEGISFTMTCRDAVAKLSGARLFKYLRNWAVYENIIRKWDTCPLTGYCRDYDLLQPIHEFMKRPETSTTFEDLMGNCLRSWLYACKRDWLDSMSEEAIRDTCDANEYRFDEHGRIV